MIDVGKITGKGVAIAWIDVTGKKASMAGVITIPPPTPKMPESTPAPAPIAIAMIASATVTAAAPRLSRACRVHPGTRPA